MMTEPVAFDSHKFVKRLTENGFTEQQAEVLADEQVNLLNGNLATKTDIEELRLATKADIEELRQETKTAIAATRADIEKMRLATEAAIAQTRADIEELRQGTKADIEKMRLATEAAIAQTKVELLKWVIGALIAQGGLVVALIKLFQSPVVG